MYDIVAFKPAIPAEQLGFTHFADVKELRIVYGLGEPKKNRALLKRGIDMLMSPEQRAQNDSLRWRHSGLDEAIMKDLKNLHIAVGFTLRPLLKMDSLHRADLIGRMQQNVRLCQSYKIPMVLCSLAQHQLELCGREDLRSFGRLLGMSGAEVNAALNFMKPEKGIREVS